MLRWGICDIRGGTLADVDDPLGGSQVVTPLNNRITGTLNLSFDDPAAPWVRRPLARVVKCWLDGEIIAAGPILKPKYDMAARTVTVPFFGDPSFRLEKSFVNNRGDTNFNSLTGLLGNWDQATSTSKFTQEDQALILWRLIQHARPTQVEMDAGVPDIGIVQGTLQSGGVLRDRTYETGAQIWQQVLDMTGVIDGIDMSLTPVDRSDGVLARFDTFYRLRGEDKSAEVAFECGFGLDNCMLSFEPAGDEAENRVTYQGVYTEGDPPNVYQSNQVESQLVNGIYQQYVGRSDVLFTTTLEELAKDECASHAFPPDGFEITPALDDGTLRTRDASTGEVTRLEKQGGFGVPPKVGPSDLWVGDIVAVRAYDRPAVQFEGAGRIYEVTLTGDADGAVIPELKTTPEVSLVEVT